MKRSGPLKRSAPMKRTPLGRTIRQSLIVGPSERTPTKPLTRPVNYCKPAEDKHVAVPKREYVRSPALLAAVRTLPCMHSGAPPPSDPAHSNQSIHGKGKGIKADDNRIAALSREVHRELDQGKKWTQAERERIWWDAHVKTVAELLRRGLWPKGVPVPSIS